MSAVQVHPNQQPTESRRCWKRAHTSFNSAVALIKEITAFRLWRDSVAWLGFATSRTTHRSL